jgi:hypothetical protein
VPAGSHSGCMTVSVESFHDEVQVQSNNKTFYLGTSINTYSFSMEARLYISSY